MASFTATGDVEQLVLRDKGELVSVVISGEYDMVILFQREVPGGQAWETLASFDSDPDVNITYTTQRFDETLRLVVYSEGETAGEANVFLTDISNKEVMKVEDARGDRYATFYQDGLEVNGNLTVGGSITAGVPNEFLSLSGGVVFMSGEDVPVDFDDGGEETVLGTGNGFAGTGSLYADTLTGDIYSNIGDADEPAWSKLAFSSEI